MTTVATPLSGATDPTGPTAPTDSEIDVVDAGLDSDLVDAAFEDLDPDPVVASLQTARDRLGARGDFDAAKAHHQQVLDMRATQAAAARAAAFDAMCRGPADVDGAEVEA